MENNKWAQLLAYVTGLVNQELLLRACLSRLILFGEVRAGKR